MDGEIYLNSSPLDEDLQAIMPSGVEILYILLHLLQLLLQINNTRVAIYVHMASLVVVEYIHILLQVCNNNKEVVILRGSWGLFGGIVM